MKLFFNFRLQEITKVILFLYLIEHGYVHQLNAILMDVYVCYLSQYNLFHEIKMLQELYYAMILIF